MNLTKKIFSVFSLVTLLSLAFSCSNAKNEITTKVNNDTASKDVLVPDDSDTESVFIRYTAVKKLTREWNAAIDQNHPEKLNDMFADTVNYYVKHQGKKECIDSKIKWLSAHPGYRQRIKYLEVYHDDDNNGSTTMFSKFTKVCIDKGDSVEIQTYLRFTKTTNGWKIDKETDQPSNASIAKKTSVSSLPPGEYTFGYGYWTDTRDIEDFAHDEVPYWQSITIKVGKTITGEYSEYSGTMREITYYLIPEGKIENGILDVTVIYNENEEMTLETYDPNEVSESQKQHWHYKIINGNELVNMDEKDYRYGESWYLDKK